jgi:Lrp/AsnC family transcriptional regulator
LQRAYLRLLPADAAFPQTGFKEGHMALDKIDRKILALLQKDATTPVAEIGRKVGLSTTPCWRRIQKMEEDGVIKGRVAILDPARINAGVTVFVSIKTNEHNDAWMRKFSGVVEDLTEVVEFYRMSGDVDYLLRVVVPDIAAYDAFYKKLIGKINLTDVSSSFAMGQIKYTTALPLEFVNVADDDK